MEDSITSNKEFYFLRHGETDWNRNSLAMGQTDIPLNERGILQAKNVALFLKNIEIASVAASPLIRARYTAEIVADKRPITMVDDFKEASWGIMEAKPIGDGAWINNWRNGGAIENGELYSVFAKRIINGLNKVLALPTPVLIVSHGVVYWVISHALQLPAMDLKNCSLIYHRPPDMLGQPWFASNLIENESI